MRLLVAVAILLFAQKVNAKDLCLCCGTAIVEQDEENCGLLVSPLVQEDVMMLQKLCEQEHAKLYVNDYYGSYQRSYYENIPYLAMSGWSVSSLPDFFFDDCQKDIDNIAGMLFWLKKNATYLPFDFQDNYLARKVADIGRGESISQLGRYRNYWGASFRPYKLDGYPDISAFPGTYEFLIRRLPLSYEVTNAVKKQQSSREIEEENLGVFTYHNPSPYPQKFAIDVAFPSDITYETDEYLVPGTPLQYSSPNETLLLKAGEFISQPVNYTVTFNITIEPRHTISAKVIGVWTKVQIDFTATLNTTLLQLGSYLEYTLKHNVTGKKIQISFGRFYLSEIQEINSDDYIVLSYSAISGILFCVAFILFLVLLFYITRKIKKCCVNKPSAQGYTVLNE